MVRCETTFEGSLADWHPTKLASGEVERVRRGLAGDEPQEKASRHRMKALASQRFQEAKNKPLNAATCRMA